MNTASCLLRRTFAVLPRDRVQVSLVEVAFSRITGIKSPQPPSRFINLYHSLLFGISERADVNDFFHYRKNNELCSLRRNTLSICSVLFCTNWRLSPALTSAFKTLIWVMLLCHFNTMEKINKFCCLD